MRIQGKTFLEACHLEIICVHYVAKVILLHEPDLNRFVQTLMSITCCWQLSHTVVKEDILVFHLKYHL